MSSENVPEKRRVQRQKNVNSEDIDQLLMTPSRKTIQQDAPKTPVSAIKSLKNALTPRRSARKSIKPAQDYDEIILNKRALRTRNDELEFNRVEEHKWSPSKVGRISQKRSARKSRSAKKSKAGKNLSEDISNSSEDNEGDGEESKKATSQKMAEVIKTISNTIYEKDSEVKLNDGVEDEKIENRNNEIIEVILNSTFDKDSGLKLEDEDETENQKTEIVEEILNSTFDKDSELKLEDEDESKTVKNQKTEIIEEKLNSTFDKDSELKLEDEDGTETVKNQKTEIIEEILNSTFDKNSELKLGDADETKTVKNQKTEIFEDMLNSTFDKDSELKLEDKVETETVKNQRSELIEDILKSKFDTDPQEKIDDKVEVEKAENPEFDIHEKILNHSVLGKEKLNIEAGECLSVLPQDVIRKDSEVLPTILKFLEEGSELGCTPILYDDHTEAEKEELKENKILTAPASNNETFEKVEKNLINNAETKIMQHNYEVCQESENKEPKVKQSNEDNEHLAVDNDSIDLGSDDNMICLVVSDDETSEKDDNQKESLNDTFNASDCVIISPAEDSVNHNETHKIKKNKLLDEAEKRVKQSHENYFSPNRKAAKNVPKIVFTDDTVSENLGEIQHFGKNRQNAVTPITKGKLAISVSPAPISKGQNGETPSKRPITGTPSKIPINRRTPSKRLVVGTPSKRLICVTPSKHPIFGSPISRDKMKKQEPKGYRFPTPYKAKKDFKFCQDQDNEKEPQFEKEAQAPPIFLTTLEPKEIVLRSIRKRSLSVTMDGDQRKRRALNVTFHSPSNQTASIADLDKMLEMSAAKSPQSKRQLRNEGNVTRRKRSLSLDEKFLRQQPSKLPRPVRISPQKFRPTMRTRLPNFAAIHRQQFDKMENLVDYVARKAERAQNLTSSALKALNSPSSEIKKSKPNVAKSLALTSGNKENASKSLILPSCSKNLINVEKPLPLTPNQKIFSAVLERNKSVADKLNKRTKRHIDMFKACSSEPKRTTTKNADIIRGVRSNRRFELMMKHRKTNEK